MTTSSSILRSKASTALLGLSKDSWERDSFSLGIRWDLEERSNRVSGYFPSQGNFSPSVSNNCRIFLGIFHHEITESPK